MRMFLVSAWLYRIILLREELVVLNTRLDKNKNGAVMNIMFITAPFLLTNLFYFIPIPGPSLLRLL